MTPTQQLRAHGGRLEVLDAEECMERLRSRNVGRLAFFQDGEIEVFPVNYVVDSGLVAFRTTGGSKLRPATQYATVTFEVDGPHEELSAGWSVVVKGSADAVSSQSMVDRLDATGLQPWARDVDRPIWVVIHPRHITGRAIRPELG